MAEKETNKMDAVCVTDYILLSTIQTKILDMYYRLV
jgi:hypothetical protein